MRRLAVLLFLVLVFGAVVSAQSDPLNSAYKPSPNCSAGSYPSNVALSGPLVKLFQTASSPSAVPGSSPCVFFYAFANEIQSFQVHVQGPSGGYSALTISMSNLTCSTGPNCGTSQVIPAGATFSSGSESGTTVTVNTTGNHYLQTGNTVIMYGCTPTGYNGVFKTTSASGTSFQYTATSSGLGSASGCEIGTTFVTQYEEQYIDVTRVSMTGSSFYNTTGYYPDPLVPFVDPYYGQVTNGVSASVASGVNQSYWVDVHIPPTAPSGWYSGTLTVSNSGTTIAALPVVLGVWQWPSSDGGYLPTNPPIQYQDGFSENSTSICSFAGTGSYTCTGYPGGTNGVDADIKIQDMDNKVSYGYPSDQYPDTSFSGSAYAQYIGPLLAGSAGHVISVLPSPYLSQGQIQCSGGCSTSSTAIWNAWANYYKTNGWQSRLIYTDGIFDEPSGSDWTSLIALGNAVHSANTYFIIPTWATSYIANVTANSAQNAIDTIVVNNICMETTSGGGCGNSGAGDWRSTYDTWLSGNCCGTGSPTRTIGAYLSCDPACGATENYNYPSYNIDGTMINNRVMEWDSYRNGLEYDGVPISMEDYYLEDYCFINSCGGSVNGGWGSNNDGYTFGDGDLWYAGSQAILGSGVAADIPIWCPSLRVKARRDGMQDYQYMQYLYSIGQGAFVNSEVNGWITNMFTFNATLAPSGSYTTDLPDARYAMGEAIHQLTFPSGVSLSCTTTSFGNVNVGSSSSPSTCTVANNSPSSATLSTPFYSFTGTNPGDFSEGSGTCTNGGTLSASGGSCTFTITFTPAASGTRSATLNASYSGGDGASPQTLALSGTGVAATRPAAATTMLLAQGK